MRDASILIFDMVSQLNTRGFLLTAREYFCCRFSKRYYLFKNVSLIQYLFSCIHILFRIKCFTVGLIGLLLFRIFEAFNVFRRADDASIFFPTKRHRHVINMGNNELIRRFHYRKITVQCS